MYQIATSSKINISIVICLCPCLSARGETKLYGAISNDIITGNGSTTGSIGPTYAIPRNSEQAEFNFQE